MKKIELSILIATLLSSCASNSDELLNVSKSDNEVSTVRISAADTTSYASIDDVITVASKGFTTYSRGTSAIIESIKTVKDDNDNDILYVVNYANNSGYILISASKDYHPILAYSDEGNFDISDISESAANLWFEDTKINIQNISQLPTEFKQSCRAEWSQYIKKYQNLDSVNSRSLPKDPDEEEAIRQEIENWKYQGYDVYTVAEYMDNYLYLPVLPSSMYSRVYEIYNMAANSLTLEYPRDNYYIIYKNSYETTDNFKMLTTKWKQGYPYNLDVPYYNEANNHVALGCATIALGQILKYKANLTDYDFSLMPDDATTYNSELCRFLYDLGKKLNIDYKNNDTGTTIKNVESVLKKLDYSYSETSHDFFSVLSSLRNGNPVYMRGTEIQTGIGHAWVCDGAQYSQTTTEFKLMMLDYQPEDLLRGPFIEEMSSSSGQGLQYLHMNWGWGDGYNGFYRDGDVKTKKTLIINGKTVTETNGTFSKDRKNLINITYKK